MPPIIDNAICIRCWDFSETSQTVSLLAREHGIIRGLAKGSKREKGNYSGGFDVLTRGELMAIVKPGRDLATLTAWHLQEPYPWLRKSLPANKASLYMADLVHHMLVEHDPHPALFDSFSEALMQLGTPGLIDIALLRFQWTLLGEAGYQPELNRDAQTGQSLLEDGTTLAFSAKAGGVVADTAENDRWRVRRETIQVLRGLTSNQAPLQTDAESVRRANRLLAVYFREIIGSDLPAMRWAFPDLTT